MPDDHPLPIVAVATWGIRRSDQGAVVALPSDRLGIAPVSAPAAKDACASGSAHISIGAPG